MNLDRLSPAQRATLDEIEERAECHDATGSGFGEIAFEIATGDPVIYIYDWHDAFLLRPDGTLELDPEPAEQAA